MKRLLAVLLLFGLLQSSGCVGEPGTEMEIGTAADTDTNTNANADTEMIPAQTAGETETITIMHADAGKEEFAAFIREAEEVLELQIEVVAPPQNADNRQAKISTMLASGDTSVDIFSINDEMISEFKHLSYLEPLDKDVMTEDIRACFPQDYMEKIAMIDGRVYSVPYLLDIMIFWVNEEYLLKAGLTEIKMPADFEQLLAVDYGKDCYGYGAAWEVTYVYNDILLFINFFGGDYYDWDNENTRNAMVFLHDLLQTQAISESQLLDQYDQMAQKFIGGYYGSIFMYSGAMDVFVRSGEYDADKLHAAPLPQFWEQATNIATWQYVLNKASEHKDAAKAFLNYAASREGSISYARHLNRLPARIDVILEEDLDIVGGEELKAYIADGIQLKARPLSANAMEDIEAIGTLFGQYMTDQITLDEMCVKANQLVNRE